MGLKKDLHAILKALNGDILTCDQLEVICKRKGRKLSNGERRLRPSDSPEVDTIRNEKKYIIGYCWKVNNYPMHQVQIPFKDGVSLHEA